MYTDASFEMGCTSAIRAKSCSKPLVLFGEPQGYVRGVPTSSYGPKRNDLFLACTHALLEHCHAQLRRVSWLENLKMISAMPDYLEALSGQSAAPGRKAQATHRGASF